MFKRDVDFCFYMVYLLIVLCFNMVNRMRCNVADENGNRGNCFLSQ